MVLLLLLCTIYHIHTSTLLTDQDINNLYKQYVKPYQVAENETRYVPLPMHKNILSWKWEGRDFPRVISLLEFERFIKEHTITSKKALAINGIDDPEWLCLPTTHIRGISYEQDKRYDLHTFNLDEHDFDFVMVNQTLEHVYDPVLCLKNIYKHMKSGGILYFNVPANSVPHDTPFHHFTGFTPVGAGAVAKAAGFEILHIGQWGNQAFLHKMFETLNFLDYRSIENDIGRNDFRYPVITWVFAQKK